MCIRDSSEAARDLWAGCQFLGVKPVDYREVVKHQRGDVDETKVKTLIDERAVARARKDFKESDRIRDELAKMGVVLKDSKDGTTWEIAR